MVFQSRAQCTVVFQSRALKKEVYLYRGRPYFYSVQNVKQALTGHGSFPAVNACGTTPRT